MVKNKLKYLLYQALNSSIEAKIRLIQEFQNTIWNDISINDEDINDFLTDAAYRLDFYEPNEEWRKEDPSYYGDERLEEEIMAVIQKLDQHMDTGYNNNLTNVNDHDCSICGLYIDGQPWEGRISFGRDIVRKYTIISNVPNREQLKSLTYLKYSFHLN